MKVFGAKKEEPKPVFQRRETVTKTEKPNTFAKKEEPVKAPEPVQAVAPVEKKNPFPPKEE